MNHKRGRARNRRAGCELCKPWKVNGVRTECTEGEKWSDHKRRECARMGAERYRDQSDAQERMCRPASSAYERVS